MTTQLKHSPGPWKATCATSKHDGTTYLVCVEDADGKTLLSTDYDCPDISVPDGLLMAAAPELYEACEKVFEYVSNQHDIDQKLADAFVYVLKALNKAKP